MKKTSEMSEVFESKPANTEEPRVSAVEQAGGMFQSEKSTSSYEDGGCSSVPSAKSPNPPQGQPALVEEEA